MSTTSPAPRPLRTDAERNREAILAAAAVVYADRGCETSLEAVAKLAGVGVGTVYRRFPNKGLLIEALLEGSMRDYAEKTEAAAALARTEPWAAFREHVLTLVTKQAVDRAFSEVVSDPSTSSEAFRTYHRRALRASLALMATAKKAGVLRPDAEHRDLLLLTRANHGVVQASPVGDTTSSLRLAGLLLDALRAAP